MVHPYKGNANLEKLLKEAGETRAFGLIMQMVEGSIAAPEDLSDPYAFTKLFRINGHEEAREQLLSLKRLIQKSEAPFQPPIMLMARLRSTLRDLKVAGFYVPRADEFRGEYVPQRGERLAWLTNFTGSAGEAIVMTDKAAFFTDGRYTLQSKTEVDATRFQIFNTSDPLSPPALEWLTAHMNPGEKFLIDPWLHSSNEVANMRKALKTVGADLSFLSFRNLIDGIWDRHPPEPISPVVPQPEEFAGISAAAKIDNLQAVLDITGVDAMVLTMPEEICWLLNIRGGDVPNTPFTLSYAIVPKEGPVSWYVNPFKVTPEIRAWLGDSVQIHDLFYGMPERFKSDLKNLANQNKKIWVDPVSAPFAVEDAIVQARTSAEMEAELNSDKDAALDAETLARQEELKSADLRKKRIYFERSPVQRLKAMKNKAEIEGAINAHLRDGAAVTRFLAAMAEQGAGAKYDELTAAELLLSYRRENALFRGLSFDTIAGSGENGAVIHYRSSDKTNKPLTNSPMFLVDSGAQYQDGTTDITRTISVDTPTAEMRENFTRVLKGHIQIAMAVFPEGTAGKDIDPLARAALQEVGLDYAHGTGHGVGSYLSVHEGPQGISSRATYPFEPGMILSNEPGYYKEGAYGIRNENLIYVVDTQKKDDEGRKLYGFKTLTLAPFDRNLIEPSLMTESELKWLNDYHAEVRAKILPLVENKDPRAAEYLKKATEPIYPPPVRSPKARLGVFL